MSDLISHCEILPVYNHYRKGSSRPSIQSTHAIRPDFIAGRCSPFVLEDDEPIVAAHEAQVYGLGDRVVLPADAHAEEVRHYYNHLDPTLERVWFETSPATYNREGCLLWEFAPVYILIRHKLSHLREFVDFCALVSKDFPDSIIMAGEVSNFNLARNLYEAGADIPLLSPRLNLCRKVAYDEKPFAVRAGRDWSVEQHFVAASLGAMFVLTRDRPIRAEQELLRFGVHSWGELRHAPIVEREYG